MTAPARPAAPHQPGKIITLPPGVTILDDPKDDRPHVALTPCGADPDGILAYGSTRPTEAASNAAYYVLKPQRTGVNRNGLRADTYVYPAILVRPTATDLKEVIGFTKDLGEIRKTMVEALELGRGTWKTRGAPTGSYRGKIMCVRDSIATALDTKYVVVVTGHVYSAEQNYQAVVPIYNAAEIELDAMPDIITVDGSDWISRLFGRRATCAAFVIPFTHSLRHKRHFASTSGQTLELKDMRALEAGLCSHFSLP